MNAAAAGVTANLARMDALISQCQAHCRDHMTSGPCAEAELQSIEDRLGAPLPPLFRLFLQRTGGGVYYLRHEIFGARRVMIHDIELVPDLLTFREWLGAVPGEWLPIHRSEGRVHAIELGQGESARVRPLDGVGPTYPDFA